MTRTTTASLSVLASALLCAGCYSIGVDPSQMDVGKDVEQIPPMRVEKVCIEVNPAIREGFTQGLFEALRELDLATQSRQTAFGDECRHWMRYDAAWGGLPEYLIMADIRVFERDRQIGHAVYDATRGSSRPDRFGSATEKLKPLLESLFLNVERGEPEAEERP